MYKLLIGLILVSITATILRFTRCDVTCQKTKAITESLTNAKIQQEYYNGYTSKAGEYLNLYKEELKKAKQAKLSQWSYEKQASNIYGSGLAFGSYAHAGWDEGLADAISGAITPVMTGTITGFIWRVNSEGRSKLKSELCIDDCSATGVLNRYGLPIQPFIDYESKYKVKKELIICIAWADSHLGKSLKSKNNIGNVGNNDRGQTIHYKTINDGIEAMYRVLNNKYLSHKQSIGSLSVGGGGSKPYYATSPENRNLNVLNCMNTILDPSINEDRNFRL